MNTHYSRMHYAVGKPNVGPLAPVAFLILFPGFFFYHTLVSIGALGAFLGGYFTITSLALFFPLAYLYYNTARAVGYQIPSIDFQFGFFLLYFLLIVVLNAAFGAIAATVQLHLFSVIYFVNIYLIFKHIDFSSRTMKWMAFMSLAVMTGIIFAFSEGGSFQPGQTSASTSPESAITYQGFARSYLLTFIPVVCFIQLALGRLVLYAVAALALFFNGARSELVAVLLLIPAIEIFRVKTALHMLGVLLVMLAILTVNPQAVSVNLPESRVWELFDLSSSESVRGRYELTHQALDTIAKNPILGSYGSYAPGQYSHNLLSAWIDLGIFGFAYIVFMLVQAFVWFLRKGWFVRIQSEQVLLAWALTCTAILLLITSKTFNDMLLGAAMGAYARCRDQAARRRKVSGGRK